MSGDAGYWERLGADWVGTTRQTVWRAHNDRVVGGWLAAQGARKVDARVLKTDAFEEAVGDGLSRLVIHSAPGSVVIDLARSVVTGACRRHAGLGGIQADVRRLPFADRSFGLVVSTSTLDHFPDAAQLEVALGELARVLQPGGALLLTLDNAANPLVALRNLLGAGWRERLRLTPYAVGYTCGPRRLRRLVRAAGLEVCEVTAILHCPRAPAVWLAGLVQRWRPAAAPAVHRCLAAWEVWGRLPTRSLTGYFVALHARRPSR